MKFHYGGIDAITGALTSASLGSIFRNGGSLLAGGTWSSDSGDGLDDRCVFITTAGEVAIFEGNPADATWAKVGVYDLGRALGVKGMTNIAGDLCIATADGIIPVSAMVNKDPADLRGAAITDPISPTWAREYALGALDWRVTKWPRGGMLVAAPLTTDSDVTTIYVANLESRAWAEVTGWEPGDIEALGDGLYLGGMDGTIYRAWAGGSDAGVPFTCQVQFPFNHLGNPATRKVAGNIRSVWKARTTLIPKVTLAADYLDQFPTGPNASGGGADTSASWDVSDWDVSDWGTSDETYSIHAKWRGVNGHGFALAPQVQITSSSLLRLSAALERVDLTYTAGGAVA
jgi:hypothetical protein